MKLDQVPDVLAFVPSEIQITAAEGESESKLRRFSGVAYTGVKMNLGGWGYPVVIDLAGVNVSKKSRPILRDHDTGKVIGHTEKIEVSARAIKVEGVISGSNANAQEIVDSSGNEFPWQMSVGARADKVIFLEDGEKASVNGRLITGPAYITRLSTLKEISFVALGADDATSATVAAAAAQSSVGVISMKFDDWLKAMEIEDGAALPAKALASLKAQFDLEQKKPDPKPQIPSSGLEALERTTAEMKAKADRDNLIAAHASTAMRDNPHMIAELESMARLAMEAGTDPDKFELDVFKACMPKVGGRGTVRNSNSKGLTPRILEAAICVACDLNDVEKKFKDEELQAAHDRFRNGIGLKQLYAIAAQDNGYHGDAHDVTPEMQRAAFGYSGPRSMQANSFSTLSLPGILGNSGNKFVYEAFMAVDQAWSQITARRNVKDFKQITSYSLTGSMEYQEVGPTGELKHSQLGEHSVTNQAKTYGIIQGLSRTDIINDDLGAFASVLRRMGRGGALKLNSVFWTKFLNNSTFFASGNTNVSTGGGSALGTADGAAINAAEVIFANQTDPDGKPLGITAKILLVPSTLNNTAVRWMGGQLIVTGASSTTLPNVNVYQGRYRVVSSPYMENSSFTGYSNAAWYLLADPSEMPVIETCFLNGRAEPVIESAEAEFNTLGVQFRGYHDFGCELQETRGGVRSAGS